MSIRRPVFDSRFDHFNGNMQDWIMEIICRAINYDDENDEDSEQNDSTNSPSEE